MAVQFRADDQGVLGRCGHLPLDACPQCFCIGLHGHAWNVRSRAIPELLVVPKVHLVLRVLVEELATQFAPAEKALVARAGLHAVIVVQVHPLVGVSLVGHVLYPELELQQLLVVASCKAQAVILGLEPGGADFVGVDPIATRRSQSGRFEALCCAVIGRLLEGSVVAKTPPVARGTDFEMDAVCVARSAVKSTKSAIPTGRFSCGRKGRRLGFDPYGAPEAVPAHTRWRDSSEHLNGLDLLRADQRQGRIHMVGARRKPVHAVHLDAQPVICKSVDAGQPRHLAHRQYAHSRQLLQQVGGVAGRRGACLDVFCVQPARGRQQPGCGHLDRCEVDIGIGIGIGTELGAGGDEQQHAEARPSVGAGRRWCNGHTGHSRG